MTLLFIAFLFVIQRLKSDRKQTQLLGGTEPYILFTSPWLKTGPLSRSASARGFDFEYEWGGGGFTPSRHLPYLGREHTKGPNHGPQLLAMDLPTERRAVRGIAV